MYIGDETIQNEDVYKYLNNKKKQVHRRNVIRKYSGDPDVEEITPRSQRSKSSKRSSPLIYTCTVGRKETQANFFVDNSTMLLTMLDKLIKPINNESERHLMKGK